MKSLRATSTLVLSLLPLLLLMLFATTADAGTASIELLSATLDHIAQTSDTAWTLGKTGTVDATQGMVNWIVTATEGATTSGHLVLYGTLTVYNAGTGDATIGNIVSNLQTRSGRAWETQASDIADATQGDAATTADIMASASSEDLGSFTESAASGSLEFTDTNTNTLFSLVPQQTVAPGQALTLRFSAAYDNSVLGLADGTPVRAEVIVSFGNATPHGKSAPNVDINGNGAIDADEAHVRSVPARLGAQIPAETAGNTVVTVSDTAADLATIGTVTVGTLSASLDRSGGTVSVPYDAGTDGGSVTNCAHLTGSTSTVTSGGYTITDIDGIDLEACDTETIAAPPACTPGAAGCGWQNGDVVAYSQESWGSTPGGGNAAELLSNNFASVYASNAGLLELGIPGSSGYSMVFTDASSILSYLPASGPVGALDADLLDPSSTAAGSYGGDVLALRLDVDFSDAGVLPGTSGLNFGDLTVCNLSSTPSLNGMTVRQVLDVASNALGGGSSPYSISELDDLVVPLTGAFGAGASQYAQDHIFNGACP